MTTPSNPADRHNTVPARSAPARTPSSLHQQAWLAAGLLLCPWLATLFSYGSLCRQHPLTMLTLLPGLVVAIYLQRYLITHLGTNHRSGEEDRLFPTLGAATWITLLRAAAIVALAGFLPLAVPPGQAWPPIFVWVPGLLYLAISLADLVDGFVARRQHRETELGKLLDIETDAAGLLVALLLAVSLQRLPVVSLLVGLAYYSFLFGIQWRRQRHRPLIPLQSRPYSRIIAGVQMGLAAMALLPIFNPAFTAIAALLVMTPLLAGFVRDWLVVSCRIVIDNNQETFLDHWADRILTRHFPLALRLSILATGIAPLAVNDLHQASPIWLATRSLFCLLAAVGWMGRSAALLLAVILGCNLTPFGTNLPVLVLFGLAVTLMLTGTGPLSLWAPEDRILYRRNQEQSVIGSHNP